MSWKDIWKNCFNQENKIEETGNYIPCLFVIDSTITSAP